jgi:hypothetical protein
LNDTFWKVFSEACVGNFEGNISSDPESPYYYPTFVALVGGVNHTFEDYEKFYNEKWKVSYSDDHRIIARRAP